MEEEQMKEKYMQFQMVQQQIQQISEHVELLNQNAGEVEVSIDALKGLSGSDEGAEILAPIANGIFIKGKLVDNSNLVVNVGSDVTVEKKVPEVIKLLEEQKMSMIAKMSEAETVLHQLNEQAMGIFNSVEEENK